MLPILTYHQIALPASKGAPYRSLCVAPADFARQMGFLALLGYRGLSMTALLPYIRGERQGKVFGITLDDGYVNNLTHALPVLQQNGFSATCYVVSQLQSNVWDRDAGIAPSALMNASQLRQWVAGGQEVGAHTRHHVHLPQLKDANAREEVALCKSELEHACGAPVHHFCYPYGEFSERDISLVQEAGYHTATTTRRGRCRAGDLPLALPRVPVLRSTTRPLLWAKVATRYEDRRRE